jgi:hypothetical protein
MNKLSDKHSSDEHDDREAQFDCDEEARAGETLPAHRPRKVARVNWDTAIKEKAYPLIILFLLIIIGFLVYLKLFSQPELTPVPPQQPPRAQVSGTGVVPSASPVGVSSEPLVKPVLSRDQPEAAPALISNEENTLHGGLPMLYGMPTSAPPDLAAILSELEDIKKNTATLVSLARGEAEEHELDSELLEFIQRMTEEIRQLTVERDLLLTQVDEMMKGQNRTANARSAPAAATPAPIKPQSAPAPETPKVDPAIAKWNIIGLSANRAVIRDGAGKIHNLGPGDKLGNVTIKSVDLKSGNVATSAGLLVYGSK